MSQQPQQTLPSAPGSPALVVTSNVQKYAIKKKKVLSAEEAELFELTQAAGITVDQEVFKIIVDLLKMNVAPQAVFQTLKAMCAGQRVAEVGESSTVSHAASAVSIATTAPTEAKG
ncbi:Mitotic-spindle organizing protein 2 [Liparis tanakae]|uniref:Mitotic-spindle organizing protein 2 n=1 Tax=Liparis tanakae TaxID=230148 RepID=A0A4Z2FE29_9TELE|nr:Mitotic-spindle organizing protein 2 [Liparis tanakae]